MSYNIHGYRQNVNTTLVDINNSGNIHFQTTPSTIELISTSSNDTSSGSGARSVLITGIDGNYDIVTDIITLNGTTVSSASSTSFLRVFKAEVNEVGTYGGTNDGIITIRISSGGATILKIDEGICISESSLFCVPRNTSFNIKNIKINIEGKREFSVRLMKRESYDLSITSLKPAEVLWKHNEVKDEYSSEFANAIVVPEKTDVWVKTKSVNGTGSINVDYDGSLVATGIVDTSANIQSIDTKIRTTSFGEIRVANRTNLIDLKSSFGQNEIRDITEVTGLAGITNIIDVHGEYVITTTANGIDAVDFRTREKGKYTAGIEAECGIAVRLGDLDYNGNDYCRWGYFDDFNGYYYQYDSNGLRCFVRKAGLDVNVPITADLNRLVGNNQIIDIDFLEGHIYNIGIVWYGYGNIVYYINIDNFPYQVASYNPGTTGISTLTANLPISLEINNNGTAQAHTVYVAGRQFSYLGDYISTFRLTPVIVLAKTIPANNAGSTDGLTPIFAVQNKSPTTVSQLKFQNIEVLSDEDVLLQVFLDSTLIGSSFSSIPNVNNNDTLLELDTSLTDFTANNLLIYSNLVKGGTRQSGSGLSTPVIPSSYNLTGTQNITIAAKSLGATATIDIIVNFQEEY